jgi:8-oxo-dGTP diphosphatase
LTRRRPKTHCHYCGSPLGNRHVDGRRRLYCSTCAIPLYENPVPATAVVVVNGTSDVLMVKRNVAPKMGHWCLPGGFMELGESPETAALRELLEEAGVDGRIDRLLGVVSSPSPRYHTVLMVGYLVKQYRGTPAPGDDADAAAFWPLAALPPIAFNSHAEFLRTYCRLAGLPMPDVAVVP